MKYAYADPPYLGCCRLYQHHHPDGRCWDDVETHAALIEQLSGDYDGWALSLSTPSLREILPMCPPGARVAAWTKPFAIFKPNVNPGYTWEPVIFHGGRRKRDRKEPTVRDYCSVNITLKRGLTGAKPEAFCEWVLDLLGVLPGDEVIDLFPGTGVMGRVADIRSAA